MCVLRYEGFDDPPRPTSRRSVRYEERLVLVEARHQRAAWERATKACRLDTLESKAQTVTFVGISDVLEVGLLLLEPPAPGIEEVYCRFVGRKPRVQRAPPTRKSGW